MGEYLTGSPIQAHTNTPAYVGRANVKPKMALERGLMAGGGSVLFLDSHIG